MKGAFLGVPDLRFVVCLGPYWGHTNLGNLPCLWAVSTHDTLYHGGYEKVPGLGRFLVLLGWAISGAFWRTVPQLALCIYKRS